MWVGQIDRVHQHKELDCVQVAEESAESQENAEYAGKVLNDSNFNSKSLKTLKRASIYERAILRKQKAGL